MTRGIGRLAPVLLALLGSTTAGQEPERERFDASASAALTARFADKGREIALPGKVQLVLDGPAAGMFLQAQADSSLSTKPLGLRLPFGPPKPVLEVAHDVGTGKIQVLMTGSVIGDVPTRFESTGKPLLLLLRQRDQVALFSVPPTGGKATLVALRLADYRLRVAPTRDYGICKEVAIRMGERVLTMDEFHNGIALDCLDEAKSIVVSGTGPRGSPFEHTYAIDYKCLHDRLEKSYRQITKKLEKEWQGE